MQFYSPPVVRFLSTGPTVGVSCVLSVLASQVGSVWDYEVRKKDALYKYGREDTEREMKTRKKEGEMKG
jgi:hypothetical protein